MIGQHPVVICTRYICNLSAVMGLKQYIFATTQVASVGIVFSLPRKLPGKRTGTRPNHSAFRLNLLNLSANLTLEFYYRSF